MISLDQVILLEKKVESAVAKIQQLKAENDALRSKCSELTNALSAKSEQLSSFANDQSQIENGIKKALERLNSIENSVLKSASSIELDNSKNISVKQQATFQDLKPVAQKVAIQSKPTVQPVAVPVQNQPQTSTQKDTVVADSIPAMYMMDESEEETAEITKTSDENFEESFVPDPADEIFDQPIGSFDQDFSDTLPTMDNNTDTYVENEIQDDFDNISSDSSDEQTDLGFDIF